MDPTLEAERPLDGRNVAPDLGIVEGEGGQQRVKEIERARDRIRVREVPASDAIVTEEGTSYYGMPVLKEPVWRWYVDNRHRRSRRAR